MSPPPSESTRLNISLYSMMSDSDRPKSAYFSSSFLASAASAARFSSAALAASSSFFEAMRAAAAYISASRACSSADLPLGAFFFALGIAGGDQR